jgi:hypothetical protein
LTFARGCLYNSPCDTPLYAIPFVLMHGNWFFSWNYTLWYAPVLSRVVLEATEKYILSCIFSILLWFDLQYLPWQALAPITQQDYGIWRPPVGRTIAFSLHESIFNKLAMKSHSSTIFQPFGKGHLIHMLSISWHAQEIADQSSSASQ